MNAKELARLAKQDTVELQAETARVLRTENAIKEMTAARFLKDAEVVKAEARQEERRAAELLGELPVEDKSHINALRKSIAATDADLRALAKEKQKMLASIEVKKAQQARLQQELVNALHAEYVAAFEKLLQDNFELIAAMANLEWHHKAVPQGAYLSTLEGNGWRAGLPRWKMQVGANITSPSMITEARAQAWLDSKLAELLAEDAAPAEAAATDEASDPSTDDETVPK